MTDQTDDVETAEDLADAIADLARDSRLRVGVAESLTSGAVASALGKAADAGEWFSGSVVAYDESVKFDVLGVTPGPVITGQCAEEMAVGVRELLDADIAVSLTGAGGPDAVEGQAPGTVFLGWSVDEESGSYGERFDGAPEDVVHQSVVACLRLLLELLEDEDEDEDDEDDTDEDEDDADDRDN